MALTVDEIIKEIVTLRCILIHSISDTQRKDVLRKITELELLLKKETEYCRLYGISLYGSYFS